ncbi:hypothetical protein B0I26_102113 [Anoxybacillus vitaminiphilus]|uniref:Uncharacterized protein n=1 Tax=Paranoxybacillus vitaminiphilus TaxID=581036 RepID=A0A327YQZ8_9BACL|nr:hypothetical protein [Anoxybacillus vitaminiphilus]RAK22125.1 hypothetical protein B0I26_102113 [Anoxybacillus vitaminiphilus]
MNEEQKTIQLEQKIIHLKSELEKYKIMLASFPSDQQSNHLKEQMEQLKKENAHLQEKGHHYEETISAQKQEIDSLSTQLQEAKEENRLLYEEMKALKKENFILQKKVEANEEKIKSLLKDAAASKQKQAELEKEKESIEENMQLLERELSSLRVLMKEKHLSFQSQLESFTSWKERIATMEKDYDFLKKNSDKALSDFQELKEVLFIQKQETENLKEEIRLLMKKFHAIEENLLEIDREKQKDLAVLQKHILHQHVEMEATLEKTAQFAQEIEKISKQLSDLTKRIDQKKEDSPNLEMSEMKEMLSQLVHLLTPQPNNSYVEEKQKETTLSPKQPSIKKNTGNTPSHTNSFLKLNEFIDETHQSIVVSPIKKKGQNPIHPQMPYVYPQKTNRIKNVRIETKLPQQLRHKQSEEDDDKSPNALIQTFFNTSSQDNYLSDENTLNHILLNDLPELKAQLSMTTGEDSESLETAAAELLETDHTRSTKAEEENDCEIVPTLESLVTVQAEKNKESNIHENLEAMKCEAHETAVEPLLESDETNSASPIISDKVQKTVIIEANFSDDEIAAHSFTEQDFHNEPLKQQDSPTNETVPHEKDVEDKKWKFFSLLKKAKVFNNES